MLQFTMLLIAVAFMASCPGIGSDGTDLAPSAPSDYKQAMRDFVQGISAYAKRIKTGFIIIPQNGHLS